MTELEELRRTLIRSTSFNHETTKRVLRSLLDYLIRKEQEEQK